MTDESVGSIAWLADMLGRAWAPLSPIPLAPIDSGLAPVCSAAPAVAMSDAVVAAVPTVSPRRAGSRGVGHLRGSRLVNP